MKIAIVHDYIKEYGGAERVLEELIKIYPTATVYTSIYLPKYLGPHQERFRKYKIKTSFLQFIPFKQKLISPFRLLSPLAFRLFNFSGFDVIIVSQTGAYFPNTIDKGGAKLVCYTHTPPRYLYGFATAREWKKNIFFKVLGELANHFLRILDFKSAQNVDYFIANSQNVVDRIKKFYRREATVIYPPVEVASSSLASSVQFRTKKQNTNLLVANRYFLAGGRLARPKHIDLIVRTLIKLAIPLKVFGKGFAGYGGELVKIAGKNIDFLGEISDSEKFELMRNAKAYIFAAEDEDFGITPVEAMMVGTPVIAYKSGGVLETVIENITGIFFDTLKIGSLSLSITRFETLKFDKSVIIKHAEKFSGGHFDKEIKDFISKIFK